MGGWDKVAEPRVTLAIPTSHPHHLNVKEVKRFYWGLFWALTMMEIFAMIHLVHQKDVIGAGAMFAYLTKDGIAGLVERLGLS